MNVRSGTEGRGVESERGGVGMLSEIGGVGKPTIGGGVTESSGVSGMGRVDAKAPDGSEREEGADGGRTKVELSPLCGTNLLACSRAVAKASIVLKRCCGFLASAVITTSSTAGDISSPFL
jgi:hypothetical protein